MADYKKKLEEWQKTAKEKVREIDEKFNLSEKVGESVKLAQETVQRGAETVRDGVEKLRENAEKITQDSELADKAKKVVDEAAKKVRETGSNLRETAENIGDNLREKAENLGENVREKVEENFGEKAGETFDSAQDILQTAQEKASEVYKYTSEKAVEIYKETREQFGRAADNAAKAFNLGASWTRIFSSASTSLNKTANWVQENPVQAAGTGFSMLVGATFGVGLTALSTHWFVNSALPAWSVKKASEMFNDYLKTQEELVKNGDLSEAEVERVKFERDIVKFVGAPLLGAFSCAAGATMFAGIFSPKTITGAPISWLLGGNPLLEGIWLFGNGVVCFKVGYEFFMIALEDQEDVQKLVREIKGLIPQTVK